jgi:hypothetical protein
MGFHRIFKTQLVRKFNLGNVSTVRNTFMLLFFATNTGRFIMYSGITKIYYRKTVGHTLAKIV